MKRRYGLDRDLGYDQRSGARCVEGAHRFSFWDREVAMSVSCGDLDAATCGRGSDMSLAGDR